MHKKITLSIIFISQISIAHNLPQEKLEQLKERSPQEKYLAEKEQALYDLKVAGTCAAVSFLIIGFFFLLFKHMQQL